MDCSRQGEARGMDFLAVFLVLGWKVVHARLRAVPVALVQSAAGRVVVIDPGHGGADPGAVAASGLLEKDVTLAIALHLERLLQGAGVHVVLTRRDDTDLADPHAAVRKTQDLTRRVAVARAGRFVCELAREQLAKPSLVGCPDFLFSGPGSGPAASRADSSAARLAARAQPATGGRRRLLRTARIAGSGRSGRSRVPLPPGGECPSRIPGLPTARGGSHIPGILDYFSE